MAECKTCGISFEPKRHSRAGKFCSLDCYYALGAVGPRKATVKGPRMRTARGHPLAPPSGIVAISRLNLYDKIGPGPHNCHWCGAWVAWVSGGSPGTAGSLLVDHLDWDNQNDDPSNLVPACNTCNSKRAAPGKRQKIQPGEPTIMVGKYRTRAKEVACAGCGEMFLTLPSRPKKYCSSRCANGRAIFHPRRKAT